ncbi:MAG: hypothetical protein HY824_12655 [Acidobacteria bacterium]|nr:hypothetical protein [Acidobacteriota bacterium]
MTRRRVALIIAGAGLASAALVAQDVLRPAGDGPAAPLAISGSASSAEYCVSGYAARIHSLGWIDAGTTYRVTFDSGISLVAAVARMNLSDRRVTSGYGTPDLNFTASSSGIMALLVSSNGRDGCYRYKAQITSPAASVAVARPDSPVRPDPALALPKSPIETMAIAGEASSARHCIAGTWTAKVHDLGWVGEGARVTIDFDSNFDAIAGLTITDVAGQSTVSYVDDNAGGNLDPRFNLTTTRAGTAVLYVGGVNGSAGCYAYKAAITAPAVTLSQFNGSWSGTFTGSSSGTVAFSVSNGTVTVTQPDAGSGTVTQRNALGLGIVPLADCIDGRDCGFHGQFFTRAATGTCTWSGPFLPGGARQSSATGLWSCTDGRSGEWNSRRGTPPAPVPTPTPTPTPAPTPTPTPGGRDGQYRAVVSARSCSSAGGAFIEPCNWQFPSGGCDPQDFTFNVTGGVVRDACLYLSAATIGADGRYTGFYGGSASSRMPVGGTFSTSFQITGTDTYRNNTYRVTIQVTKTR